MTGLVHLTVGAFRELLVGVKQRCGDRCLLPERPAEGAAMRR